MSRKIILVAVFFCCIPAFGSHCPADITMFLLGDNAGDGSGEKFEANKLQQFVSSLQNQPRYLNFNGLKKETAEELAQSYRPISEADFFGTVVQQDSGVHSDGRIVAVKDSFSSIDSIALEIWKMEMKRVAAEASLEVVTRKAEQSSVEQLKR